jgi:hypothetical protein
MNTFFIEKKTTTYALRKQCRVELALKRIAERQKIIDARSNDTALFYKIIYRAVRCVRAPKGSEVISLLTKFLLN